MHISSTISNKSIQNELAQVSPLPLPLPHTHQTWATGITNSAVKLPLPVPSGSICRADMGPHRRLLQRFAIAFVALTALASNPAAAIEKSARCDTCTTTQQFLNAVPRMPNVTTAYVFNVPTGEIRKYDVLYEPETRYYEIDPVPAEATLEQLLDQASVLYNANHHSLHFNLQMTLSANLQDQPTGSSSTIINLPAGKGMVEASQPSPLPTSAVDYLEGHNVGGFNTYVLDHLPWYSGVSLQSFMAGLSGGSGPGFTVKVTLQSASSVQALVRWPDTSYCSVTVTQGTIVAHVPGSCYDSHGNHIPESPQQVAHTGSPTNYDFGGSGYPGDMPHFLENLSLWHIPVVNCDDDFCSNVTEYCYEQSPLVFHCVLIETPRAD